MACDDGIWPLFFATVARRNVNGLFNALPARRPEATPPAPLRLRDHGGSGRRGDVDERGGSERDAPPGVPARMGKRVGEPGPGAAGASRPRAPGGLPAAKRCRRRLVTGRASSCRPAPAGGKTRAPRAVALRARFKMNASTALARSAARGGVLGRARISSIRALPASLPHTTDRTRSAGRHSEPSSKLRTRWSCGGGRDETTPTRSARGVTRFAPSSATSPWRTTTRRGRAPRRRTPARR